jgi:tripartite-type tricarboxylate transporter receptor subunit TctC
MRRSILCLFAAAALAAGGPAAAQDTAVPLRIIVPLPSGGTSDIIARMLSDALRIDLGRPVIVDNRPGATGRIAVDALKRAVPDGSTLLLAPIAAPVIVPLVLKDVNYDPVRDLVPVAQVSTFEYALAVAPDHPARSLAEFIDWAKANRGRATFGTPGAGSAPHLVGTLLAKTAGIELLHIPYRGAAGVEVDVMNGQVTAAVSALPDLAHLHRAGKLRILATSGARRAPLTPDVPTFGEQGFASLEISGWQGVFAPAKTPPPIVERLSAAIVAALRTPAIRERFVALGLEPTGTTPQALAARVTADIELWRQIVKASGFVAE